MIFAEMSEDMPIEALNVSLNYVYHSSGACCFFYIIISSKLLGDTLHAGF
jgi:hypothetical protein